MKVTLTFDDWFPAYWAGVFAAAVTPALALLFTSLSHRGGLFGFGNSYQNLFEMLVVFLMVAAVPSVVGVTIFLVMVRFVFRFMLRMPMIIWGVAGAATGTLVGGAMAASVVPLHTSRGELSIFVIAGLISGGIGGLASAMVFQRVLTRRTRAEARKQMAERDLQRKADRDMAEQDRLNG